MLRLLFRSALARPCLKRPLATTVEDYVKSQLRDKVAPGANLKKPVVIKPPEDGFPKRKKAKVKPVTKLFTMVKSKEGIKLNFPELPHTVTLSPSDVESAMILKERIHNSGLLHMYCDGASSNGVPSPDFIIV